MKKGVSLFLLTVLLFLTACGHVPAEDVSSTTDVTVQTQTTEPITSPELLSANETYGDSGTCGGIRVRDESVRYRTADSRRLEPVAVQAAQDMLRDSLGQPDSLEITDCNIWDCVDDGENTYYSLHLSFSYIIASGGRINSGEFYSVGVQKTDETAFDATAEIDGVIEAYSIFRSAERNSVCTADADDSGSFAAAARQIASSRFKNAESGKILSVKQRLNESDDASSVWDVLAEGENDFGMSIPDIYSVYLRYADGKIAEFDPADPDAFDP